MLKRKRSELSGSRSIRHYFSRDELHVAKKQQHAQSKIVQAQENSEKGKIVVAHRRDGQLGGEGAYFDHYTLRLVTASDTVIAYNEEDPKKSLYVFKDFLRSVPFRLSEDATEELPEQVQEANERGGLLFIPGISRRNASNETAYQQRITFNKKLIQNAYNRGQPVLAVCGGCWELWQFYGGKLKPVEGHNYRQGMPRINTVGKVGYNKQIHRIRFSSESYLLSSAMQVDKELPSDQPTVNSVHWQAPDDKTIPGELVISARAVEDLTIAPFRNKEEDCQQRTEEDTIEAFESRIGAPVLGIQWHPEAYTNNTDEMYYPQMHQNILHYMVKAGSAYQLKQAALQQIKNLSPQNELISIWSLASLKAIKRIGYQFANPQLRYFSLVMRTDSLAFAVYQGNSTRNILSHQREAVASIYWKKEFLKEKYELTLFRPKHPGQFGKLLRANESKICLSKIIASKSMLFKKEKIKKDDILYVNDMSVAEAKEAVDLHATDNNQLTSSKISDLLAIRA